MRDTGIGIALEKQALIFEAFSQADASTTRKFGGTGLGLTISARLVEAMKGTIWVESTLGNGSSFHFTVCVGVADDVVIPPVEAVSLAGIPVLVVDDNSTNRRILSEMLWTWHMRPTATASAQEALSHMRRACERGQPFELVLSDVHMPEADGFDFVERIRENPKLAGAVIMMLTSGEKDSDIARYRRLDISAHLVKPIRRNELRAAIVRALTPSAVQTEPVQAIAAVSVPAAPSALPVRILLAEDVEVNQQLARRILEKAGHTVVTVGNGREALAALRRERFDVVLMDVQMPEMDGFEATSAIRSDELGQRRHVPIIAMTAHAMTGDRERCIDVGMDAYISKPIRARDLLAIVHEWTKSSAAQPT